MKTRLAVAFLLISATAFAQPSPQGFTRATSFEGCTKSWAFACGMRSSTGQTFGTAKEMTHCEKYTFLPNGTYTSSGRMLPTAGTYRVIGKTVRLTVRHDDGGTSSFDLVLSTDGSTLGSMKRL
jgi:hypothetical protein